MNDLNPKNGITLIQKFQTPKGQRIYIPNDGVVLKPEKGDPPVALVPLFPDEVLSILMHLNSANKLKKKFKRVLYKFKD